MATSALPEIENLSFHIRSALCPICPVSCCTRGVLLVQARNLSKTPGQSLKMPSRWPSDTLLNPCAMLWVRTVPPNSSPHPRINGFPNSADPNLLPLNWHFDHWQYLAHCLRLKIHTYAIVLNAPTPRGQVRYCVCLRQPSFEARPIQYHCASRRQNPPTPVFRESLSPWPGRPNEFGWMRAK